MIHPRLLRSRISDYRPAGTVFLLIGILLILSSRTLNSDSSQSEYTVQVTILPSQRMSVQSLSVRLDSCQTLAARQRLGLRLLSEDARATQSPILAVLRTLESQGQASNIESRIVLNSVSARVSQEGLAKLSSLSNVAEIRESAALKSPPIDAEPEYESVPSASHAGVEDNLRFIGADSMWRMGFTGKGRIVAHFDGGDIYHPAIGPKWKGWDGDIAAAWETDYPWLDTIPYASGHGTNTYGILLGSDPIAGDTVGVAIDARWIAGRAFEDNWSWLADPDRDINTTADIPDVLVWSRGLGAKCEWSEQESLELVEALGIVVAFAAGNSGPAPQSIGAMGGAIAIDSLTNFSIGSVDHRNGTVWWSSSRGPSPCDGVSIKPNLAAPGASVRSTSQGGGYSTIGGTSFAAPHVAGAVALLRQAFPNITPREIKEALLAGATPAGSVTPNNDYGWGILNIPRSYEFLKSRGHSEYALEVAKASQLVAQSDDTLFVALKFQSRGHHLSNTMLRLDEFQSGFRCLNPEIPLGDLETGEFGSAELQLVFDDTVFPGQVLPLHYRIASNEGELPVETIEITVGGKSKPRYFTHNTGQIRFSVTNTGQFGYGFGEIQDYNQPVGFRLANRYGNLLRESSLLVATDSLHVSDGSRTTTIVNDNDWWGSNLDTLELVMSNRADKETRCVFWDGAAERPIGISVEQRTMSFSSEPDDRFILLEYRLSNRSHSVIKELVVGMFTDWTIDAYRPDKGFASHHFDESLVAVYNQYPEDHQHRLTFLGTSVLSNHSVNSVRAIELGFGASDYGMSEAQKYEFLAGGKIDTAVVEVSKDNLAYIISVGPFDLEPGESETVAFAIVTGDSPEDIRHVAERARLRYRKSIGTLPLAEQFEVQQNYPNPFNSSTVIPVEVKLPGSVRLEIFNLLGQRVVTLLDQAMPIGSYRLTWDGRNIRGQEVASGIYFARVTFEGSSVVRKMMLLK